MNTTARTLKSLLLAGTLLAARPLTAQADDPIKVWNYPAPVRTWEIEAGARVPVNNDTLDTTYYRVTYQGSLIDTKGTPLSPSQHFEITEPKPQDQGGDRSALELSLENGAGSLGGTMFEMNGATPFELRGFKSVRGAAYVGADSDGNNLKAAVGIESRPFRIPLIGNRGVTNWLVIGLMGERSEATDNDTNDGTYGLVTGRLFIGKAFGWRKSANPAVVTKIIEDSILENAPDLETAKKLADELRARAANSLTAPQQTLVDAVGDIKPDDKWPAYVHKTAVGIADALTDQPTFSVYLEASGWNAFSQQDGVPQHRGLVTLTTDYWPLASRDDVILRARYEWGFQRTAPDLRVNQFLVTLNVQL